jgi:hypothetical protein
MERFKGPRAESDLTGTPSTKQTAITKVLGFEYWSLFGLWDLYLGVCHPVPKTLAKKFSTAVSARIYQMEIRSRGF